MGCASRSTVKTFLKLGIDVGQTSVGKYMVRLRKPPSQTWRTFLDNHVKTMVSVNFFVTVQVVEAVFSRDGAGWALR